MNFSRLKPISGVYLTLKPDLICIFAMSIVGFSCFYITKISENSTWQNPEQLFVAQILRSLIHNSVAELRITSNDKI